MKINLICSDPYRPLLQELLSGRNITQDAQAELCLVEAGYPPPQDRLCILFQPGHIPALLDLLNRLASTGEENGVIIGRIDDDRYAVIAHE